MKAHVTSMHMTLFIFLQVYECLTQVIMLVQYISGTVGTSLYVNEIFVIAYTSACHAWLSLVSLYAIFIIKILSLNHL